MSDPSAEGRLKRAVIEKRVWERGLKITVDGKPASLAVIDAEGNIVESGPDVVMNAWAVAVLAYREFLKSEGTLRVYSTPEGFIMDQAGRR